MKRRGNDNNCHMSRPDPRFEDMEGMSHKNGYLKEAKKILKVAVREYDSAKKKRNELKARQAAEKGYLCLLTAVNAFLTRCGVDEDALPKNERGRTYFLGKYADRDFRRKYNAVYKAFHIDGFHEGIINYRILKEHFEDLEELIKRVGDGKT